MSEPTGYIVRPGDMKALTRELNRVRRSHVEIYAAARTLVRFAESVRVVEGWAEPQQTQLSPVSVASLALPSEGDALDRIADAYLADQSALEALAEIADILSEMGRL